MRGKHGRQVQLMLPGRRVECYVYVINVKKRSRKNKKTLKNVKTW